MKTLFYCDICNKSFEDKNECAEHEKHCHSIHDKGIALAHKINEIFNEAKEVCVPILMYGQDLDKAEYIVKKLSIEVT